jgi:uncharacterized membrane protein HdeD (DUF308 family)
MDFDLRLPIGILFSLFGLILTIYGALTRGSEIYDKSLKHNINLEWGAVLLVFGVIMLVMSLRARKN